MNFSRATLITIAAILAMVLLGLLALGKAPLRANMPAGGDFAVRTADGPLALQDLRGKVVLLYFGYTYCPDICPTALLSYAAAFRKLSPQELEKVAGVFISVDPERDSLPHLKEYARFFHPHLQGATASPTEIQEIARRYGVFYARQPADASGRYAVDHTADSYIIDGEGRLVARLPHGAMPETIADELKRWMR